MHRLSLQIIRIIGEETLIDPSLVGRRFVSVYLLYIFPLIRKVAEHRENIS